MGPRVGNRPESGPIAGQTCAAAREWAFRRLRDGWGTWWQRQVGACAEVASYDVSSPARRSPPPCSRPPSRRPPGPLRRPPPSPRSTWSRSPGRARPATRGVLPAPLRRLQLRREQDAALAGVGSPTPVYRWTTALNGVAVRLTAAQAAELAAQPDVVLVEKNGVRRLAGTAGRGREPDRRRLQPRRRRHRDRRRRHRDLAGEPAVLVGVGAGPGATRLPRRLRGWPQLGRRRVRRQAGRRPLVRRRLRRRQRARLLLALAARRRRPRHRDGLDRGRQRRGVGARQRPAARQLRRRGPAGAAGGLQGLLDGARTPPTTAAPPPTW